MLNIRKLVLKLMAILLIAAILPFNVKQAKAQGGIVVEEPQVAVSFGQSITFQAKIFHHRSGRTWGNFAADGSGRFPGG